MRFAEIRLGFRVSYQTLEHVVYARLAEPDPNYAHLPPDDQWVILSANIGPSRYEHLSPSVFPTPEAAVLDSVERARKEIAENEAKIARLSAALAQESEASGG